MLFKDLLASVTKEEISGYFEKNPNEFVYIQKYFKLYDELLTKDVELSNMSLFLVELKDYLDSDSMHLCVYGLDLTDNHHYALDFLSRSRWLGSTVVEKSLNHFGRVCFVCECLTEMSCISFDETVVEEELDLLNSYVEEIESGNVKYFTADEVFSDIREEHGWVAHTVTIEEKEESKKQMNLIKEFNDKQIAYMLGE